MASSFHLVRSVGRSIATCSRVLFSRNGLGQLESRHILPAACWPVRFQHSDMSGSDAENSILGAEAEKAPVLIDNDLISKMLEDMQNDMPVYDMENPYKAEHKRCILCKYDVDVNYKNVRLLSQFVSPHTGRIYGRAVTGLCIPMQKQVARAIKTARIAGFMPVMMKKSEYMRDPRLFDPFKKSK